MTTHENSHGTSSQNGCNDTALDVVADTALETAVDALFTAVAMVRQVLHTRAVARDAACPLTPDTEWAQEAYVSGMVLATQAQQLLAVHARGGAHLPPYWLAQGVVDTLAGTVRLTASQQREGQARAHARTAWVMAQGRDDTLRE